MANTAVGAIYKALKDQYDPNTYLVRYPYAFDELSLPYIYMYEVSDPRISASLCDTRGGEARVTIGLVDKRFDTVLDGIETIIAFVEGLRGGSYSPITIWDIHISDVRDINEADQSRGKKFRREFDAIVRWGTT